MLAKDICHFCYQYKECDWICIEGDEIAVCETCYYPGLETASKSNKHGKNLACRNYQDS